MLYRLTNKTQLKMSNVVRAFQLNCYFSDVSSKSLVFLIETTRFYESTSFTYNLYSSSVKISIFSCVNFVKKIINLVNFLYSVLKPFEQIFTRNELTIVTDAY